QYGPEYPTDRSSSPLRLRGAWSTLLDARRPGRQSPHRSNPTRRGATSAPVRRSPTIRMSDPTRRSRRHPLPRDRSRLHGSPRDDSRMPPFRLGGRVQTHRHEGTPTRSSTVDLSPINQCAGTCWLSPQLTHSSVHQLLYWLIKSYIVI